MFVKFCQQQCVLAGFFREPYLGKHRVQQQQSALFVYFDSEDSSTHHEFRVAPAISPGFQQMC